MHRITENIRRYWSVSDGAMAELAALAERVELPRKTLLTEGGRRSRHMWFIEQGFARSYCLHRGREVTIWFSREGDMTYAMEALYHNRPGYEYVELLEDSVLYAVPIADFNRLCETNHEFTNWSRVIHQEYLLFMDRHHNNRLFLSARERYHLLLQELPDVIHRANLSHIASYLGITQQHLSRLRAEK